MDPPHPSGTAASVQAARKGSMMFDITAVGDVLISAVAKIALALVVWIIGKMVVKKILKLLEGVKSIQTREETLKRYLLNGVKWVLYAILVISVIGILGIPMASVIAVLASAGLAVGMAMQGSLGNIAGGIMLLIFRPFKVGDYINAAGGEGVVKEISLFYTVLNTTDNKTVTIPNGALMNANVTNMTAEALRRVDLTFGCAKGEDVAKVQQVMLDTMAANDMVVKDPEPFARLSGGTNEAMEFTVRAWCDPADYWDVYFDVTGAIVRAFGREGVQAPALRVLNEQK